MRLLVCGGRNFLDRERAFRVLDELLESQERVNPISLIIHGGASGADALAHEWALARCIPHVCFPADWKQHGKRAGMIRNHQMLTIGKPHMVLAFPGGVGTSGMCEIAMRGGVPVTRLGEPASASQDASDGL